MFLIIQIKLKFYERAVEKSRHSPRFSMNESAFAIDTTSVAEMLRPEDAVGRLESHFRTSIAVF